MALCQYCEDIDPDAIWKTDMGNPKGCPRVDYELQRSTSMRFSAQKGCPGCRFFLDVIRQDPSDAKAVDEALHRDERIWIQAPFLLTINIANNRTRLYDLDLCLGKAEHDLSFAAAVDFGPRRPIAIDPSTESCMRMAASWLERCASHEGCPPQVAVPLPTRLVEIPQEGQECKLHISGPSEKGHYVTLSHCWGPAGVTFLLRKTNLEQLRSTIQIQDLPRSFQDAITITRRLGFRYLWIDAICVIQDSVDDWAHESARMAEIYRNGSLMISAVAAPDGQHGILRPRDILRSHFFGKHKEFIFQTRHHVFNTTETDGPLHTRGWCLQERIMAPRILHFGKHKLVWECASQICAEDLGHTDIKSEASGVEIRASAMPFIWPTRPGSENGRHQAERLTAFYQCVGDFTKRRLTKRSDKLPAFSGLASAFQTPELGAYLAGLWEKDLVCGLDWSTWAPKYDEDPPESGKYIAPSWSWASMRGRCKFTDIRRDMAGRPQWEAQYENINSTLTPRLLSYHIELATSDPYGRISAASITLRSYTRPLLLWLDRPHKGWPRGVLLDRARSWGPKAIHDGFLWMFGPSHKDIQWEFYGHGDAPSASDKKQARRFVALPVGMASLPESMHPSLLLSMLVLDPVEGLEETYRRVGRVEVDMGNFPREMEPVRWEERDLTLI